MGSKFDTETIKLKEGQNIMELLSSALTARGMIERIDGENNYFFINNVNIKSINAGKSCWKSNMNMGADYERRNPYNR